MTNMRFHAIALSCIVGAVILIFAATGKLSPKAPATSASPSATATPEPMGDKRVTVWEASWGLNCNEIIERERRHRPVGSRLPVMVQKNNVLKTIADFCKDKEICEFIPDEKTLGNPVSGIRCRPELDLVYRCFDIDRPWPLHARNGESVSIRCKGR